MFKKRLLDMQLKRMGVRHRGNYVDALERLEEYERDLVESTREHLELFSMTVEMYQDVQLAKRRIKELLR